jgi:hypothetical protein
MLEPEKQSVENPPTQPAEESSKVEKTIDFDKKVQSKTYEYEQKVLDLKKRFRSTGSIGEKNAELLTARQINRLRAAAARRKEEFNNLATAAKAERASALLSETEQDLVNIYFPYEKIIDHVRGMDKLDDAELVKLEALMEAMVELKTNPALEKLFLKAMNHEKLDKKELEFLVEQINPVSLNFDINKKELGKVFESSQIGAVIGVMAPGQKMELLELILQNKPVDQAMGILEVLLTANQITNLQLQDLLAKGKIPEPQASILKKQMEGGQLSKKQEEYQHRLDQLTQVNQGRTAENPLAKTVGPAGAILATGLFGLATALVNLKANWDSKDPFSALTRPYVIAGFAAFGASAAYTASLVDPEKYGKYKDKVVGFFDGPKQKKQKEEGAIAQLNARLEHDLAKNPHIMEFLGKNEEFPDGQNKTGLDVIKEIVTEKQNKKQDIVLSYSEILEKSGPHQKESLTKAYSQMGGNKDLNFKESLFKIMGTLTELDLNDSKKLNNYLTDLKKKQGVS